MNKLRIDYKKSQTLRQRIEDFVGECLQVKLAQLPPHQLERRSALIKSHQIDTWLDESKRHVEWLQLATHTPEPQHIHSRSPHICIMKGSCRNLAFVGTQGLASPYPVDGIGTLAEADVLDFLNLVHDGKTVLQRILANDLELKAAVSTDTPHAQAWRDVFAGALRSRGRITASAHIGQVRFRAPDGKYHALMPLFPTTLVHRMHQTIFNDHFNDGAVAARNAHKEGGSSPTGYRDYPDLAIRTFGRSKARNVSLLNRTRHGESWLLPSLPPKPPQLQAQQRIKTAGLFGAWLQADQAAQDFIKEFRRVIPRGPGREDGNRKKRRRLTVALCDEALQYALRIRNSLPPSWSTDPHCRLPDFVVLWLDPCRAKDDIAFRERRLNSAWPMELVSHFTETLIASIEAGVSRNGRARSWKQELVRDLGDFAEILEHYRD